MIVGMAPSPHAIRALFAPLLLLPLFAPRGGDELQLVFTPETGQELRFEIESGFESTTRSETHMETDGEEVPLDPAPEYRVELEERVVFLDRFERVEEGSVLTVARRYETLEGSGEYRMEREGESDSREAQRSGPLEGRTVRFSRESADEAWSGAPDQAAGFDASWIEGLEPDGWFRGLLPGKPVEIGASWEPAPEVWFAIEDQLLWLPMLGEEEGEEPEAEELDEDWLAWDRALDDALRENGELELTCRLTGVESEDGRRLAAIEIEVEFRGSARSSRAYVDEDGDPTQEDEERGSELHLKGALRWDLERGRAERFDIGGEQRFQVESDTHWDTSEGALDLSTTEDTRCTIQLAVRVQ